MQEWGVRGTEPGQFEEPMGPAVDSLGRVYFFDRSTGFIQKFEPSGTPLLTFEDPAARLANAIAVDYGGAIYIANAHAGVMQLFFPQGERLRSMRIAPQRHFEGPYSFTIDPDGKIYVPDPTGARVQVFSSRGLLLKTWRIVPGDGHESAQPFAVVSDKDGLLYVGDASGGRILKLTGDGQVSAFIRSEGGDADHLLSLATAGKHIFALRGFPLRLEVWNEDGNLELTDTLENRLSAVKSAACLAANGAGDLIVLDPEARRVLRFRVHLDLR